MVNTLAVPAQVGTYRCGAQLSSTRFPCVSPQPTCRVLLVSSRFEVSAPTSSHRRYALDDSWGYSHGFTVGESGYICDWSDVQEGTLDMPTCTKGICGGHRELDVLPFKIKVWRVFFSVSFLFCQ